jgi:hypothetical protein
MAVEYGLAIVYQTDNQRVHSDAQQVWFDIEHPNWGAFDPISIDVNTEPNKAGLKEFIRVAKITSLPTVLFLRFNEDGTHRIITRLTGNVSYAEIMRTARALLRGDFDFGEGIKLSKKVISSSGLPMGAGVLNVSVPNIVWGILGLYAGYKAFETDSNVARVAFSGVSAVALGKIIIK